MTNSIERPDPEDDPFACSICGYYLSELKRVRGDDYCDLCQREYGQGVFDDAE